MTMIRRQPALSLFSSILLVFLAACNTAPTATPALSPPRTDNNQSDCTILFGAAVPLTGKTSQEGKWVRDGYNLYVEKINAAGGFEVGPRRCAVEIKYYDDMSDPDTSAQLVERLITEDHVNLLLGTYSTDTVFAGTAVAEKYQIPMVEAGGSGIKIFARGYRYVFGMLPPAPSFFQSIIDLVLATDPTVSTVALLVEDEGFSTEVANGAAAYAQEKGLTVVYRETYPKNTSNVTGHIRAIRALQPDLVFGAGHFTDSVLVLKTAKAEGLNAKLFAFTVGPTSQGFRDVLAADARYVVGTGAWTEAMKFQGDDVFGTPQAFGEAMRAKYGVDVYATVPYQAAAAAAGLEAYRRAIQAAGTYEDPQAVRDALAALNFNSFYGNVAFSPEGIILKPMAVVQIGVDDQLYTVYPLDARNAEFLFPVPRWDQR
jgi:branched-chain amino acid transport system substrate-binding protein